MLRKVSPSKMWWWVAMTSKSLWLPAPSKIASPSPAALMVMGFSAVPFQGKRPGAGEWRAQRVDVVQAFRTVKAGMDEYGVAGLNFVHADGGPIAAAGAVIGVLESDKARLLARAFMIGGIHVEDASALVRISVRRA